jgi:UDP-N-acetylglucosamine 2-epimerase
MIRSDKEKIICTIMGTRPEMIKLAALIPLLDKKFNHYLISTGQHFSDTMFEDVRKSLGLRRPDIKLRLKNQLPKALQLSKLFQDLYLKISKLNPKLVIVQGDTFSTLLGSLVAKSLNIKLFHIEAGARSFDQRMPEETIRIAVDHLADLNQAFSKDSLKQLKSEKIKSKIVKLPNTGIETIHKYKKRAIGAQTYKQLADDAILITLHRNTNVDDQEKFQMIWDKLLKIGQHHKVLYIAHPRVIAKIKLAKLSLKEKHFNIIGPIPYLQFLNCLINCKLVISDSGGIVEECNYLRKKLIILRESTEYKNLIKKGLIEMVNPKNLNNQIISSFLKRKIPKHEKFKPRIGSYVSLIN